MKNLTQNGAGSIPIDIPIDLKTKLLTSESTFVKSLSRMVVNKVLKSKVNFVQSRISCSLNKRSLFYENLQQQYYKSF